DADDGRREKRERRGAGQEAAHCNNTVACATTASPFPTIPSPSAVLPLTFTRSGATPRSAAIDARMAARWGAILGVSQTSTASAFVTSKPAARARATHAARSARESAFLFAGSLSE